MVSQTTPLSPVLQYSPNVHHARSLIVRRGGEANKIALFVGITKDPTENPLLKPPLEAGGGHDAQEIRSRHGKGKLIKRRPKKINDESGRKTMRKTKLRLGRFPLIVF